MREIRTSGLMSGEGKRIGDHRSSTPRPSSTLLFNLLSCATAPLGRRGGIMAATTKRFAVFDGDTHVVEPPELWERFLDPQWRSAAKQALWRQEGAREAYLK